MNKYIEIALHGADSAVEDLHKFTMDNTNFEVAICFDSYPIRFVFTPSADAMQQCLFETDADGAVGEMVVIYSSGGVGIDMSIKHHIQADILKKLLKKCATCGEAYLHANMARMVE